MKQRLEQRSTQVGKCILWTGRVNNSGYGQMVVNGRNLYVHRIAYELSKGTIPAKHQIDHLCKNKLCINPEHLEAITQRENIARSNAPWAIVARTGRCGRGHEMTPENVYSRPGRVGRQCRICKRIHGATYREKVRARGSSTL